MSDAYCRLYLIAPCPLPAGFAAVLEDALAGGDVAALRIDPGGMEDAAFLAALEPVRRAAQAAGVAVILAGRPDLAVRAACDGVHLDAPAPGLRRTIGDLQLGISCGGSRDLAMQAGEGGADYVAFEDGGGAGHGDADDGEEDALSFGGSLPELIAWWVELMELPVVAEGGVTLESCPALIRAGADFIAVQDAVWAHEGGPRNAVRAFNAALAAHAPVA